MKHFLLLFFGFSFFGALAQSVIRIDSLPAQGVLFDKGWTWHAGDNPDWAKPSFDDRQWETIDPTKDIMDLPRVRQAGVGWFRLHLAISPSVLAESLALLVEQTGASEIYVNGRLMYRFGQIAANGRAVQTYDPRGKPVSFSVGNDSLQTLAIRFAYAGDIPYTVSFARQNMNPLLRVKVSDVTNAVNYDQVNRLSGLPLDYLKMGIYFILAILHLALYVYYPVQRANFYFSLFALCCLITYGLQTQSIGMHQLEALQITRIAIGILTTLFQLLLLTALYRLFNQPLVAPYWFLLAFFLVCMPLTIWPYRLGINYGHGLFYILCLLEEIRITVIAVRQKQRGAGIVVRGIVVALVFILIYTALLPYLADFRQQFYLTNNVWYFALIHLPYNISNQSIPVAISLYLGLEFAFTNKTLATKLVEIEELSAKALAQETEKRQLIAHQNEELEQTVRDRTSQLQQQADKLREMDVVKSRFFTNLTHEFRTPLTLILGPAEQVLAHTQEAKTKQQIALLQRNAQRLLRLINQLLDLSKLEAGKVELTASPGDLIGLVRGTLLSFESLAHQKQITLRFTATQDRLGMAIDRDKLEKILYNVVSNALKFTSAGGHVLVAVTRGQVGEDAWVQLSIQDTGAGIPAAKLPYLFDRFYQADTSDTREQEGTGIGLALTKELVELHGGLIHIDSQQGVGSTVTVRLPIRQESFSNVTPVDDRPSDNSSIATLPPLANPTPSATDAPLVLLIEDNDDVRAFIRSSLGNQYRILEAVNGEEGVRLGQEQVPDLVITDLMMPKMNGYQVCATLKQDERTSHIPVIMLTAKADLDSKLEGLETGVDSYLAKPFNQRELVAQMSNLITLRRQLRERYSRDTVWQTGVSALPSMEQVFLDRVRIAVEAHLADEQYSVDRLSDEIGLSRTQLHRKLKALIDQTPGDLIRLIRLQRAMDLLRGGVGTVAEVAYMVGFGNPANFSTSFSRHFGYPPSEVRKKAGSPL